MTIKAAFVFMALATASPLVAQDTSEADAASVDAIAKLDFLLGDWTGVSSVMMGPGVTESSRVTEKATLRAGGAVILLEGRGTIVVEGEERVVHDVFGAVTWDPRSSTYQIRAFRAGQGWTDSELSVDGRHLEWGMDTPGGRVRFILDFSEDGRWHEIGEIERGGQWYPFLEMSLERKS